MWCIQVFGSHVPKGGHVRFSTHDVAKNCESMGSLSAARCCATTPLARVSLGDLKRGLRDGRGILQRKSRVFSRVVLHKCSAGFEDEDIWALQQLYDGIRHSGVAAWPVGLEVLSS